uniref:Uncharacterized protein n=1 Tax=Lotharella globosa TaxID=91324 RepID=A0A7S3YZF9_9EUKA
MGGLPRKTGCGRAACAVQRTTPTKVEETKHEPDFESKYITWMQVTPMSTAREFPGIAISPEGSKLYVAGGMSSAGWRGQRSCYTSVEVMDIEDALSGVISGSFSFFFPY